MKDLLKDAIADAKAVRETALANAKLALEEAFTPRIQSMLSAKLSEELEDEMYEGDEEEVDVDVTEPTQEVPAEPAPAAPAPAAPAPEAAPEEEEMTEEDDLDLEEIIRELEGSDDEMDAAMMDEEEMEDDHSMTEEDADIDINEIIRALKEEDEESYKEEMTEEEETSSEELEEAYNVIRFLKGKINEVNLLNAKLLYSNKLFRNFVLAEGQKMKVIENFDRAHNLREVKLVYSTLAESFKSNLDRSNRKVVKESFASKPVASTKPAKQVLSEGSELANRFKKLAGLIK